VSVNDMVLVTGMRRTRATLREWNADPWTPLRAWVTGSFAVSLLLLGAVWAIALMATPDPTPVPLAGIDYTAGFANVIGVLTRNSLVLALHATACVAGFIAGSSLPLSAAGRTGLSRMVHERARPIALAWVVAVTCFSLATQAYVLGSQASTLAAQLAITPGVLVATVLPHALIELTALFLPLAAWTIASRRGTWDGLLAATVVTSALAVPALVFAATWEVYMWPHLLRAASPLA
jgi:hypothetical protein